MRFFLIPTALGPNGRGFLSERAAAAQPQIANEYKYKDINFEQTLSESDQRNLHVIINNNKMNKGKN